MLENIFNLLTNPNTAIIILILYMIGSLPFAVIISKLLALPDPRSFGSNNPGATNVLRGGNKFGAMLTLLGDSMKGYIPVFILSSMGMQTVEIYFLSFFILIGHIFPITLKFKGGKGVATSIGILFAINLNVGVVLLVIWLLVFAISRVSGLSALSTFFILPFAIYLLIQNNIIFSLSILNTFIIFLTHKNNIKEFFITK
jgi:glycerol-3-phosphate acyltransferase PlsY